MMKNQLMQMDIAIEIIADMIADNVLESIEEMDKEKLKKLEAQRNIYLQQRREVCSGNMETIKYVVEVYGEMLKSKP